MSRNIKCIRPRKKKTTLNKRVTLSTTVDIDTLITIDALAEKENRSRGEIIDYAFKPKEG